MRVSVHCGVLLFGSLVLAVSGGGGGGVDSARRTRRAVAASDRPSRAAARATRLLRAPVRRRHPSRHGGAPPVLYETRRDEPDTLYCTFISMFRNNYW